MFEGHGGVKYEEGLRSPSLPRTRGVMKATSFRFEHCRKMCTRGSEVVIGFVIR